MNEQNRAQAIDEHLLYEKYADCKKLMLLSANNPDIIKYPKCKWIKWKRQKWKRQIKWYSKYKNIGI